MPDIDLDRVDAAFDTFRASQTPRLVPAGLAPVRVAVHRRRQVRVGVLASVAVVAVLAPVGAYAQSGWGRHGLPGGGPTSAPVDASGSGRPSVPTAPATAWGMACVTETPPEASPGSLSRTQLCNGTLDIPASPAAGQCPRGRIRFDFGYARPPLPSGIDAFEVAELAYSDVDADGVNDAVAVVRCQVGERNVNQVLVFDRGPGGTIRTLGQVVAVGTGTVRAVREVEVFPANTSSPVYVPQDGSVSVVVGNQDDTVVHATGPVAERGWPPVEQWRTYHWTGAGFAQTAGSRSFLADHATNRLTLDVSAIAFETANGNQVGRATVTVHNLGGQPVRQVSLYAYFPAFGTTGACAQTIPLEGSDNCPIVTVPAGGSWQTTVTMTASTAYLAHVGTPNWSSLRGGIELKVGDQMYSEVHSFATTYR